MLVQYGVNNVYPTEKILHNVILYKYLSMIEYHRQLYMPMIFFSSFGPASNVPKLTHYGVV